MGPTVDKFHFLLYNSLKKIHEDKSYNMTIDELFGDIKAKKKFLETDVIWDNKIERTLYVKDFFGNNQLENEKVIDVSNIIDLNSLENDPNEDNLIVDNFIDNNSRLEKKRKILDKEVMRMRNYHEEKYSL